MTIKTRQYKQSVINEMTNDNDNKDNDKKQYKQSVINEMTKNDNKDKTIQTISYQ